MQKKMQFKHVNVEKLPDKVRQPYDLTKNFIRFKFSPEENRILIRMLQRIKMYQEINYSPQLNVNQQVGMRFHWKELLLPNQNIKNRLEGNLKALLTKSIEVKSKMEIDGEWVPSIRGAGIISSYEYDKGKRFVDIEIDHVWYQYLADLSMGYTEFNSKTSYKLSSSYAIKFYYFCCHWLNSGGISLTLNQFRKEFDIDKNLYTSDTASSFKRRIIIPSKKSLDASADVSFNYSEIKNGRSIIGFTFKFYKTNNLKNAQGYGIERIEELFRKLEGPFKLSKEDKARITGLVRKYSFTIVSSITSTYSMDIWEYVHKDGTLADAISRAIIKNIPELSDSNVINNHTPSN